MDRLQELLDERWPKLPDDSRADFDRKEMFRRTFTEGYNAAMEATVLPMKEVEEEAIKYATSSTRTIAGAYMAGAQDWCSNTIIHLKNLNHE